MNVSALTSMVVKAKAAKDLFFPSSSKEPTLEEQLIAAVFQDSKSILDDLTKLQLAVDRVDDEEFAASDNESSEEEQEEGGEDADGRTRKSGKGKTEDESYKDWVNLFKESTEFGESPLVEVNHVIPKMKARFIENEINKQKEAKRIAEEKKALALAAKAESKAQKEAAQNKKKEERQTGRAMGALEKAQAAALEAQTQANLAKLESQARDDDDEDDDTNDGEMSVLAYAVIHKHGDLVRMLLNYGADVEQKETEFGATPLMQAIEVADERCVRLLLSRGALFDHNVQDVNGYNCFHKVCLINDKEEAVTIVKALLEYMHQSSVDALDASVGKKGDPPPVNPSFKEPRAAVHYYHAPIDKGIRGKFQAVTKMMGKSKLMSKLKTQIAEEEGEGTLEPEPQPQTEPEAKAENLDLESETESDEDSDEDEEARELRLALKKKRREELSAEEEVNMRLEQERLARELEEEKVRVQQELENMRQEAEAQAQQKKKEDEELRKQAAEEHMNQQRAMEEWRESAGPMVSFDRMIESKYFTLNPASLHICAFRGNLDVAKLLIEAGADINVRDSRGNTPLHIALFMNQKEFADVLIEMGADLDAISYDMVTIYHLLAKHDYMMDLLKYTNPKQYEILNDDHLVAIGELDRRILKKKRYAEEAKFEKMTKEAAKNARKAEARLKSQDDAIYCSKLETMDIEGRNVLHYAAYNGNLKLCELLKEQGVFMNAPTLNGFNAIHYCLMNEDAQDENDDENEGRTEIFKYLTMACEFNVDYQDPETGNTMLSYASMYGHLSVINYLISKDPTRIFKLKNREGQTPFHLAAAGGKTKAVNSMIKTLLEMDPEFDFVNTIGRDKKGNTPLLLASNSLIEECMLAILNVAKEWVFWSNDEGWSPLQCVARGGKSQYVWKLLVLHDSNPEIIPLDYDHVDDTQRALILGIDNGHVDVATLLINLRKVSTTAPGALHKAAGYGMSAIVRMLFEPPTSLIDRVEKGGSSALFTGLDNPRCVSFELMVYPTDTLYLIYEYIEEQFGIEKKNQFIRLSGNELDLWGGPACHFMIKDILPWCSYIRTQFPINPVVISRDKPFVGQEAQQYDDTLFLSFRHWQSNIEQLWNVMDEDGSTILHHAARRGHEVVLEQALHALFQWNKKRATKLLDMVNKHGETALLAVGQNYCDCHCYTCNPDMECGDFCCGCSSCMYCRPAAKTKHKIRIAALYNRLGNIKFSSGHISCIQSLVKYGADVNILSNGLYTTSVLINTIKGKGIAAVRDINQHISKEAITLVHSVNGRTAVHEAARMGLNQSLGTLLRKLGKDTPVLNLRDKDNLTAIILAVSNMKLGCVKVLLQHESIDVMVNDEVGTLLHYAVELDQDEDFTKMLKLILDSGAGVRAREYRRPSDGLTAYELAVKLQCRRCQRVFLNSCNKEDPWIAGLHGSNADAKEPEGQAEPLVFQAVDNAQSLQMMIPFRPSCFIRNHIGNTVFHHAVVHNYVQSLSGLCNAIKEGLIPLSVLNEVDAEGLTPLMRAVMNNNSPSAKVFLNVPRVDVNAEGPEGRTAFHLACHLSLDGMAMLFTKMMFLQAVTPTIMDEDKLVVDPNIPDSNEMYPIMTVINNDRRKILDRILNMPNVDITVRNKEKRTPLHLVCAHKNHRLADLMIRIILEKEMKCDFNALDSNEVSPLLEAVFMNNCKAVEQIVLGLSNLRINHRDKNDRSALSIGIITSPAAGLRLLEDCVESKKSIDVVSPYFANELTPLHLAAQHDRVDITEFIVNNFPQSHATIMQRSTDKKPLCPLQLAIEFSPDSAIHMLRHLKDNTELGFDANMRDKRERTLLSLAIEHNRPRVVDLLLQFEGIELAHITRGDRNALQISLSFHATPEDSLVSECLLKHVRDQKLEIDINAADLEGNTPLYYAIAANQVPVVEALLQFENITYDKIDKLERNCLSVSIEKHTGTESLCTDTIVRILSERGVPLDVNVRDSEGCYPICRAIIHNQIEVVDRLFEYSDLELDNIDGKHSSVLDVSMATHTAAEDSRCSEIILTRLKKRDPSAVDINRKDAKLNTALHYSILYSQTPVVKSLLERKEICMTGINAAGDTVVLAAVERSAEEVALHVLGVVMSNHTDININARNQDGFTAMHLAITRELTKVVEMLLTHEDIDANIRDTNEKLTPLLKAVCVQNPVSVKYLINSPKVDRNARTDDGQDNSALILAVAHYDSDEVALELMDACENDTSWEVNHKNVEKCTALYYSIMKDKQKVLNIMLFHKCIQMEDVDKHGHNALSVAIALESPTCLKIILQNVRDHHANAADTLDLNELDAHGNSPMCNGILTQDVELVKLMLDFKGTNLSSVNAAGDTALNVCLQAHEDTLLAQTMLSKMVQVDSKMDFNRQDSNGWTPLMKVVQRNSESLLKLILQFEDADVNVQDNKGLSVLHHAAIAAHENPEKHMKILQLLFERKSTNRNITDKQGKNILHYCVHGQYECNEVAEYILRRLFQIKDTKFDVNAKDVDGNTALYYIIQNVKMELLELILKLITISLQDISATGSNALTVSTERDWKCAKMVCQVALHRNLPLDVNQTTPDGTTALYRAVALPSYHPVGRSVVQLIMEFESVDLNNCDMAGHTALEVSFLTHQDDALAVTVLEKNLKLGRDLDINKFNENGYTPLHVSCQQAMGTVVKSLVKYPNIDPNIRSKRENRTALHMAIETGDVGADVITALMGLPNLNRNALDDRHRTCLLQCVDGGELSNPRIAKLLMGFLQSDAKFNVNAKDGHEQNALYYCIVQDYIAAVKILLSHPKISLMDCDRAGRNAFSIAHKVENWQVMKLILTKARDDPDISLDVNERDENSQTPIFHAITNRDMSLIKLLMEIRTINLMDIDENHRSALEVSLKTFQEIDNPMTLSILETLKSKQNLNIDINHQDADGKTYLHLAVERRSPGIIKSLLSFSDINPNIRDYVNEEGALHYAVRDAADTGENHVLSILIENSRVNKELADTKQRNPLLSLLAANCAEQIVERQIQEEIRKSKEAELEKTDEANKLAQMLAMASSVEEVTENNMQKICRYMAVALSTDAMFNINARDKEGRTALYYAIAPNEVKLVDSILRHANVTLQDISGNGENALSIASVYNCPEAAITVIEHSKESGAWIDLNERDSEGRTALYHAIVRKQKVLMEKLLECSGISMNKIDIKQKTVLQVALDYHEDSEMAVAVLEKLLTLPTQHKLDVNRQDENGFTCLHNLVEKRMYNLIEIMQRFGQVNPNLQDVHNGYTPLHIATKANDIRSLEMLLEFDNTDLNIQDNSVQTPLLLAMANDAASYGAVRPGTKSALETIISISLHQGLKLDVNVKNADSLTPLHCAAILRNEKLVRLILSCRGVDVNVQNLQKKTALHVAVEAPGAESCLMVMLDIIRDTRLKVNFNLVDNTGDALIHKLLKVPHWDIHKKALAVRTLVSMGDRIDINRQDSNGVVPFILCAQYKLREAAEYIMDHHRLKLENTYRGKTALHYTIAPGQYQDHELSTALLTKMRSASKELDMTVADFDGRTIVHMAALSRNVDILKLVITFPRAQHSLNIKDKKGFTAYHVAVSEGDMNIMETFMDHRACDVNAQTQTGCTPLHTAVIEHKTTDVTLRLLKKALKLLTKKTGRNAININALDNEGRSPLYHAILLGQSEVVEIMLNLRNVDLDNIAPEENSSAIHIGLDVDNENIQAIRTTILRKALENNLKFDVNSLSLHDSMPAIHRVIEIRDLELMALLLRFPSINLAVPNEKNSKYKMGIPSPLHLCLMTNVDDIVPVCTLLRTAHENNLRTIDVNAMDYSGQPPLHYAVTRNQPEVCRELLKYDEIDLSALDEDTLKLVIRNHQKDLEAGKVGDTCASLILQRASEDGRSLGMSLNAMLVVAIRSNFADLVGKLLRHKDCDLRSTGISFYHMLDICCNHSLDGQCFDLVSSKLLQQGLEVDVYLEACQGRLCVLYAAQRNMVEKLTKMLEAPSSSVELRSSSIAENGPTALELAVLYDNDECVEILLKHNADINGTDHLGNTALHFAVMTLRWTGSEKYVERLLEYSKTKKSPMFVNSNNNMGRTAMHELALTDTLTEYRRNAYELLIQYGAHIDIADVRGRTPLHEAALSGNVRLVKALCDQGAGFGPDVIDVEGKSVLHDAASSGNIEIVTFLVENGAELSLTNARDEAPIHLSSEKHVETYLRNCMATRRLPGAVSITYCSKCEEDHPSHTRHDSKLFYKIMKKIGERVLVDFPGIEVFEKPLFNPKNGKRQPKDAPLGLFEVLYHDHKTGRDRIVYSKVQSGRFPKPQTVTKNLIRIIIEMDNNVTEPSKLEKNSIELSMYKKPPPTNFLDISSFGKNPPNPNPEPWAKKRPRGSRFKSGANSTNFSATFDIDDILGDSPLPAKKRPSSSQGTARSTNALEPLHTSNRQASMGSTISSASLKISSRAQSAGLSRTPDSRSQSTGLSRNPVSVSFS